MVWSTRQLAELADTTVNTVRHYHEVGLLDLPDRRPNGYKQYGVSHLLRLLQIRRLSDLGVPLAQIESIARADDHPDEALRVLDTELEATIERLQRVRTELALIMRHRATVDVPPGFSEFANQMSERERALITVYAQVYDESATQHLRQSMVRTPRSAVDVELDNLPADADRATRVRLAEQAAPAMRKHLEDHPQFVDLSAHASKGAATAQQAIRESLRELYNPAQLEVLYRAHLIAQGKTDPALDRDEVLEAWADPDGSAEAPARD